MRSKAEEINSEMSEEGNYVYKYTVFYHSSLNSCSVFHSIPYELPRLYVKRVFAGLPFREIKCNLVSSPEPGFFPCSAPFQ